jgi:hypothetical protein
MSETPEQKAARIELAKELKRIRDEVAAANKERDEHIDNKPVRWMRRKK